MKGWSKNAEVVARCAITFDCVDKALQMLINGDLPPVLQRNAFVPKPMQSKMKTIGMPAVKAAKVECERILVPGGANGKLTSAGSDALEEWRPLVLEDPAEMPNGPSSRNVVKWMHEVFAWVETHFPFFVGNGASDASMSDLDVQMNAFEAAQRDCLLPQLTTLVLMAWLARTDVSSDKLACSPAVVTGAVYASIVELSKREMGDNESLLAKIGRKAVATELMLCAASVARSTASVHPSERRRKPVIDKISDVMSHPCSSDLIGFVDEKGHVRFADPAVLTTTPFDGFLPPSVHREIAKRKYCFSAISVEEAVRAVAVPIFAMFNAEPHDVPAFLRRIADHVDDMEDGIFQHMAVEDKWPMWSSTGPDDDERLQQLDQRIAEMQKHMEALQQERAAMQQSMA